MNIWEMSKVLMSVELRHSIKSRVPESIYPSGQATGVVEPCFVNVALANEIGDFYL